jgi:hypothetical protein
MIEVYVLATLVAMGYLMNKTSKPAEINTKYLNVRELPSQDNIYASQYSQKVDTYEKQRAAKMYEKSLDPVKSNVISRNFGLEQQKPKVKSLTGEYVDVEKFTHNNMVPYFGGNIKQNMNEHSTKSILETHTGRSETFRNKEEVPCLYDKVKDFSYVNGIDNKDDFYRERYLESRVRNNVVPIPQVRVGPGIGQGYTANPSGGFHQLDVQELIKPYYKSVDELRVATKPKETYDGRIVEGQKGKERGALPNMAKNKVDTWYEQTPDMLLKTTGAYTKPTEIPEFNVKVTHRNETTRETIGVAQHVVPKRKLDEYNVKPSARQQFGEFGLRNTALNTYGKGSKDDYGKSTIMVYANERDLTTTRVYQGNVQSLIKAIVAPLQDVMRISKKEHGIDNPRHFGNMNVQVPDKPTMYDPNDVARTTIKETLIHDEMGMGTVTGPKRLVVYDPEEIAKRTLRETLERMDYEMNVNGGARRGTVYDPDDKARTTMKETLVEETHEGNIDRLEGLGTYINDYIARNTQKQFVSDNDYYGVANRQNADAYKTTKYDAKNTQKQFISDNDYYGTAASAYQKKEMSKEYIDNAVIRDRKEQTLYGREPTRSGAKVAVNGDMVSIDVKKPQCDYLAQRETLNADRQIQASVIPALEQINLTKDRKLQNTPDDRLDPSLLNAFNNNPYTQPLYSF